VVSVSVAFSSGQDKPGSRVPWLRHVFGTAALPSTNIVALALPQIVAATGLRDDELGLISAAGLAIAMAAQLAVAYAADRYDLRAATALAMAATAAATTWLVSSLTVASYAVCAWSAAAASTVITVGVFSKLVRADADRGRAVARYQFIAATVATVMPVLAGLACQAGDGLSDAARGWRVAAAAVAWAQLAWLFLVARTPGEHVPAHQRPGWPEYRRLLTRRRTYALILLIGLHVGADCSAWQWIVLLAKRRFPEVTPAMLGLFQTVVNSSYMLGRWALLRSRGQAMGLATLAVLAPVAAAMMSVMVFLAPTFGVMTAVGWFTWLCLSLNYPVIHACAVRWFPDTPSAVLGALGAAASLGGMCGQYLVGAVSQGVGSLAMGFLAPVCLLLALGVASFGLHLGTRRSKPAG
jgi:MFS family permease